MNIPVKPLSLGGFALALLCFLFPWVSVSCPGQSAQLFRLTGVQLAMGTSVEEPSLFGSSSQRKIPGEPLALAALGCGVVGLIMALVSGRGAKIVAAVVAGAGTLVLLLLKSKVEGDIAREAQGMLEAHWEPGYWIAWVGLVAALLGNYLAWKSMGPEKGEAT
ncbi:MAG: hypothetical protein ACK42L_03875 [Thermoanaerobaculum sp.]